MSFIGNAKENANVLVFFIKLFDGAVVAGTGVVCFFVLAPSKNFPVYHGFMPQNYLTALIIAFLLAAWWFPAFNVYKSWRGESIFNELRILFLGWSCTVIGLLVVMVFTKTTEQYSRHWLGLWFVVAFLAFAISRVALRIVLRSLRNQGFNQRHIVLVGAGDLSGRITAKIRQSPWMGLKLCGFFADESEAGTHADLSYLGNLDAVVAYVEANRIDQVWITLPLREMDRIERLCHRLNLVAVNVMLVPDMSSLHLFNQSVTHIDGIPVINLTMTPLVGANALIKWLEDKLLSLLILILISPLMLCIAIAVKLSSPGPVLYRQERVSWNGKRFQMLKFRSMPINADQDLVWGRSKTKQTTRVGQFLRRTSLDELPQFINVLKGDMSIVGPRPERTVFVEQFKHEIDSYMQKHLVHAGITGWAQVNGWRGDTSLEKRIEYDLFYVENWSLWFDLKIILLTLKSGFMNENAY